MKIHRLFAGLTALTLFGSALPISTDMLPLQAAATEETISDSAILESNTSDTPSSQTYEMEQGIPAERRNASGGTPSSYVEGEALILTKGDASEAALLSDSEETDTSAFCIADTVTFSSLPEQSTEDLPLLGATATAAADADALSISLVRSETLSTDALIAELQQQSDVLYAEPNYILETQSVSDHSDYLWALDNVGQNGGTLDSDLNVPSLSGTLSDTTEAVVAVVDTGIDLTNEDLQPYLWENPYPKQLDGEHGYDFVNNDADPTDDHGHGTHCAGIITSVLEQAGVSNVKIMAVKMLDETGTSTIYSDLQSYQYLYRAQQLGVPLVAVSNSWGSLMSNGTDSGSQLLNLAITFVGEQGALTICAAGNESNDTDVTPDYPASFDNPYIISVAATDEYDRLASFSNYGAETVDLAAPGVNILSTYLEPTFEATAFSEEQKKQFVAFSEAFSNGVPTILTEDQTLSDGVKTGVLTAKEYSSNTTLSIDTEHYFGNPDTNGTSSLCWEYTAPADATTEDVQTLYLPLPETTAETEQRALTFCVQVETEQSESENESEVIISEVGIADDTEEDVLLDGFVSSDRKTCWNILHTTMDGTNGSEHALAVQLTNVAPGNVIRIYLDELYISNVNQQEDFPTYAYLNGTSMATPYVTGATALLALQNPEADALERATDLLCATRPVEALEGVVKTGGVLDLSQLSSDSVRILSETLDTETLYLTLTGRNLDRVTYTADRTFAELSVVEQTSDKLVLDVSDYARCFLDLTFYDDAGTQIDRISRYIPTGTQPAVSASMGTWDDGTTIFTDQGTFYTYQSSGLLYEWNAKRNEWTALNAMQTVWLPEKKGYTAELTESFCVLNHKLYVIGYYVPNDAEETEELELTPILFSYTFQSKKWSICTTMNEPLQADQSGYAPSLAAGDGKIWTCTCTYDTEADNTIDTLLSYDPDADTYQEVTQLPEERMLSGAECFWSDGKIVINLETNQEQEVYGETSVEYPVTRPLVYDPKQDTWTTGARMTWETVQPGYSADTFSLQTTANDNYLIYTGAGVQGAGDLILYDVANDQYLSTGYSVYDWSQKYYYQVLATEDTLYFFCGNADGYPAVSSMDLQVRSISFTDLLETAEPIVQLGDVDEDGQITVQDAVSILTTYAQQAAGQEPELTATYQRLADVGKDNTIDVTDAVAVLTYYAKQAAGQDPMYS